MTCDTWQSDSADAYEAVTGHYIYVDDNGEWELENTLLGFVRLNGSHNGVRLGQTLFKVVDRVGATHKVSY